MEPESLTKSQFAVHMNVTRFAVSKWIKRGIIYDDAIIGEGRKAKINVPVAVEQVRNNRDIGQSLGNGIGTRTTLDEPDHSDAPEPPDLLELAPTQMVADRPAPKKPDANSVENQLKQAKLEEQLRRNRLQASDEALRQGMLISADDARGQMGRIAGMMMQVFEGALPDFAAAVASTFDVPQRDVLHLLRSEFKKSRETAEMKERTYADEIEKNTSTSVKDA